MKRIEEGSVARKEESPQSVTGSDREKYLWGTKEDFMKKKKNQ